MTEKTTGELDQTKAQLDRIHCAVSELADMVVAKGWGITGYETNAAGRLVMVKLQLEVRA